MRSSFNVQTSKCLTQDFIFSTKPPPCTVLPVQPTASLLTFACGPNQKPFLILFFPKHLVSAYLLDHTSPPLYPKLTMVQSHLLLFKHPSFLPS